MFVEIEVGPTHIIGIGISFSFSFLYLGNEINKSLITNLEPFLLKKNKSLEPSRSFSKLKIFVTVFPSKAQMVNIGVLLPMDQGMATWRD